MFTFKECLNLEEVYLPCNIPKISRCMFLSCSSLRNIMRLESISVLSEYAFSGCTSLEAIAIPYSVTEMKFNCFWYCTCLKKINLQLSLTSLGSYAFSNCNSLTEVTLSPSVVEITEAAFSDCVNLSKISIPESVVLIEERAFSGCSKLYEVAFPERRPEIMKEAFLGCLVLKIFVRQNVKSAGTGTKTCKKKKKSLEMIDLSVVESQLYTKVFDMLVEIVGDFKIYDKKYIVKYLGEEENCEIPQEISVICAYAFYEKQNVKQVKFPPSVTTIAINAFEFCPNLRKVTQNKIRKINPDVQFKY